MGTFYGKYRGKVTDNEDPQKRGRLKVSVSSVMGEGNENWALPCLPYAGPGVGLLAIPPADANVWVEFEDGNPNHPIWSGCFWGVDDEVPEEGRPDAKVFKTEAISLVLDDASNDGGFRLEVSSPAVSGDLSIVCDGNGITLSNGSATVELSTTTVSLNGDALEVT